MRRLWGLAGLAVLLLSTEAAAQEATRATPSLQQRMTPAAPASIDAQPRWNAEQRKTTTKQPNQPALPAVRGQSVALMVAGGALFVAGAIVGGDAGTLLMVGGAGVGAYGLYLYFR